jgi:hypothetical protein
MVMCSDDSRLLDKGLLQTKVVGMCIDGTLLVIGIHSGFKSNIKQITPHIHLLFNAIAVLWL